MSAITSGDSPPTNEEQEALIVALFEPDDDCAHNVAPLFEEVARMVAAARREAWERGIEDYRLGWREGRCKHFLPDNPYPALAEPERDEEGRCTELTCPQHGPANREESGR